MAKPIFMKLGMYIMQILSVCVFVCLTVLSLLNTGSVKTSRGKEYTGKNRKIGLFLSCEVRAVSRETGD
jgi:hypothetical protein